MKGKSRSSWHSEELVCKTRYFQRFWVLPGAPVRPFLAKHSRCFHHGLLHPTSDGLHPTGDGLQGVFTMDSSTSPRGCARLGLAAPLLSFAGASSSPSWLGDTRVRDWVSWCYYPDTTNGTAIYAAPLGWCQGSQWGGIYGSPMECMG